MSTNFSTDHKALAALPGPRLRLAPSPTGRAHIGTARTALFNWLYAKKHNGSFIIRVEDTDASRNDESHVEDLLSSLRWMGLSWDGLVRQTDNAPRHREAIEQLLDKGYAYYDDNAPDMVRAWKEANPGKGYRGHHNTEGVGVVMLDVEKVANADDVAYTDLLRGVLTQHVASMHDEVLARADGSVLYNLAVVVDDEDAAITHVVRGDDHLSNTYRQTLIRKALGYNEPVYVHLSLIHDEDGKKYSKRRQAPSVSDLMEEGYTAATLRNYLALLGWGVKDNKEVLTDDELIERFDLADCGLSAARFSPTKLRWLSGQKLHALDKTEYAIELASYGGWKSGNCRLNLDKVRLAAEEAQEKGQTLQEAWGYVEWAFTGVREDAKSRRKWLKDGCQVYLRAAADIIESIPPDRWETAYVDEALRSIIPDGVNVGKVFQPIRVAVTGSAVSTGVGHTVVLATRNTAAQRLRMAANEVDEQTV